MKKYSLQRLVYLALSLSFACPSIIYGQTAKHDDRKIANEIRNILETQSFYIKAPFPSNWKKLDTRKLREFISNKDPWSSLDYPSVENYNLLGIGARLYNDAGKFWLLPYQDGALMHEGVADRVQLLSIDGQNIDKLTLLEVGEKLKKGMGQPIKLGICTINNPCSIPTSITVTQQPYHLQSIEKTQLVGHNIIRIFSFQKETPHLLRQIMTSNKQPSFNPTKQPVIIDLRDNTGGDLFAAIEALDLFLNPEDEIVSFLDKNKKYTRFYSQDKNKIPSKYPLLILVSKQTASSGEIFAGVLKYYGLGIIIGEQTYGKCVSQTEQELSDGQVLRFTNIEVLLPDNSPCNKIGIIPQKNLINRQIWDSFYLSKILTKFINQELL